MDPHSLPRTVRSIALFVATLIALLAALASTASATTTITPNPDLQPACGAKVILVLDESGSIENTAGAETAVRNAANAFASGLADTGSQLAVIEFGTSAKRVFNYTNVTSGAGGTLATTFQPYFNGTASSPADVYNSPSQTGQWTNWQDALEEVKLLNNTAVAPLVVFVTDGDPTATGTASPFSTNVANATALTPAIVQANAVKAQGSHILAVGVGAALNNASSLNRLQSISGTDTVTNAASINLSTTDVLAISDFANLTTALRTLVSELCKSSVTITKAVDEGQGYGPGGAGWTFAGNVTPASGTYTWLTPSPGSAGLRSAATAADSAVTFQWKPSVSTNSTITLTETERLGYQFAGVTCQVKSLSNSTPVSLAVSTSGTAFTATLGPTDIVTCQVKNKKINPSVAITKVVDQPVVLTNTLVTYTIRATNTGDVALNTVAVADAIAPNCAKAIGTLAVATFHQYTCTATIAQDTTNTATVTSKDPQGTAVTPKSASADVDVIAPKLAITKTVDQAVVRTGTTVTYTIRVTNTGDASVTGITVGDSVAPICGRTIGSLDPGAHYEYTCQVAIAQDTTNVVTASGKDPLDNTVTSPQAQAVVDVIHPGLTITKTVDPPVVRAGSATPVTWTVIVTNTGDVPLRYVTVSDPQAPDCDRAIGTLAANTAAAPITCITNVSTPTTNVATVTGKDPLDNTVAPPPAEATVNVIDPSLSITKDVDKAVVHAGTSVQWTITVKNTGDVALSHVTVTDSDAPDCDTVIELLAANTTAAPITCTAWIIEDTTNVATATGTDTLDKSVGPVSDSASVDVIAPGLSITKSVDQPVVLSGTIVEWRIAVTNTGDVDLTNVVVSDPNASECDTVIPMLAANTAAPLITCSQQIDEATTNVATVSGIDPLQKPVGAPPATAVVDVISPALSITKSVDKPVVLSGTEVTWKIVVTNTGDVTLTNVTVTDPNATGCATVIPSLSAGASSEAITCLATITQDITNTATVTASDTLEKPVGPASASASVDVIAPGLGITKTVDKAQVAPGEQVTYTVTVSNTGDVLLSNVVLKDPTVSTCNKPIGDLAVGASVTVTCIAAITVDTVNVATATGTDPLGNPLTKDATAKVTVVAITIAGTPQTTLRIDKRGPASAKAGQVIVYRIKITNIGTATALNAVMRDRLPNGMALAVKSAGVSLVKGTVTVSVGDLAPGASKTILLKVRIDRTARGTRTNVATASASNAPQVRDDARTRIQRVAGRVRVPVVTG